MEDDVSDWLEKNFGLVFARVMDNHLPKTRVGFGLARLPEAATVGGNNNNSTATFVPK